MPLNLKRKCATESTTDSEEDSVLAEAEFMSFASGSDKGEKFDEDYLNNKNDNDVQKENQIPSTNIDSHQLENDKDSSEANNLQDCRPLAEKQSKSSDSPSKSICSGNKLLKDEPIDGSTLILERFLEDVRNLSAEEIETIKTPPYYIQTKLDFPIVKKKICLEAKGSSDESSGSNSDEKSNKEKIYAYQKNKTKHRRRSYNRVSLDLLFRKFEKNIKEDRYPTKKQIQKYLNKCENKELKQAGVENVYYILKNKIRKENGPACRQKN